jgi:hypothetical protein
MRERSCSAAQQAGCLTRRAKDGGERGREVVTVGRGFRRGCWNCRWLNIWGENGRRCSMYASGGCKSDNHGDN